MERKEAIEIVRKLYNESLFLKKDKEAMVTLIPELKENKDEKIRAKLIEFFAGYSTDEEWWGSVTEKDILAWLEKQGDNNNQNWKPSKGQINALEHFVRSIGESGYGSPYDDNTNLLNSLINDLYKLEKQGEQKSQGKSALEVWKDMRFEVYQQASGNRHEPNYSDDSTKMFSLNDIDEIIEKMCEQNPADKVEPKFKVGDWVIDKQGIVHQIVNVIENVTNHTYAYDIVGGGYFNDNTEGVRLWTIQDAKDGDVLSWDDSKCIAIFKNIYDEDSFNSYGFVGGCTGTFESRQSYHDIEGAHPATKEQRDLLFQEMKEAGYEWDADKKELKLLITNGGDFEQKKEWSEENKNVLEDIKEAVINYWHGDTQDILLDWLKSLKDKIKEK